MVPSGGAAMARPGVRDPEGAGRRRGYPRGVTIHAEHPFLEPEPDRDPVRRLRGRVGGTVTLWTAGTPERRAGLTVSSVTVAHGDPGHVLAVLDPDSDLASLVQATGRAVVALLQWPHRDLAEVFAGLAPSPGGPFAGGTWTQSAWGPVLDTVSTWAGVRLAEEPREVGWSLLVDTVVEHVVLGDDEAPLVHRRGRYVRPTGDQ